MENLYLYFNGHNRPVMTFSLTIMETIGEWCRALSMSFIIDGYCYRPYNEDAMNRNKYDIPHMEVWDEDEFTRIVNSY